MFRLESIVGCKPIQLCYLLLSKIEVGNASAPIHHPSIPLHPASVRTLPGSCGEWYHCRELYFL